MVQVKKISKYGKYFLFLAVASLVSFIWPSKNNSNSSIMPSIPQVHADIPADSSIDINVSEGAGDCP